MGGIREESVTEVMGEWKKMAETAGIVAARLRRRGTAEAAVATWVVVVST